MINTTKCSTCNKDFYCKSLKSRLKRANVYCSKECSLVGRALTRRTGKILPCDVCNKQNYYSKSRIAKTKNLFCSRSCAEIFQKRNKLEYKCKICNKTFFWSKSRIKSNNPTYCSIKCRNKCKVWKDNAVNSCLKQQKNKALNKLELFGRKLLEDLEINFNEQVTISNKFMVDVFIEEYNLIIQWDGDYWHGHPSKIKNGVHAKHQKPTMTRDKAQKTYFKKCGYNLLRFWECDVKKHPDKVKSIIIDTINEIRGKYNECR